MLLVAAAAGVAAAGVAPLWANAAEDSLILRTVRSAPPTDRLLVVTTSTKPVNGARSAGSIPAMAEEAALEAAVVPKLLSRNISPRQRLLTTASRLTVAAPGARVLAPVAWAQGSCTQLRLVAGRCPEQDRELMLSDRTMREFAGAASGSARRYALSSSSMSRRLSSVAGRSRRATA